MNHLKIKSKKSPFTIPSKRTTYLGITLTKEVQNSENEKTFLKESCKNIHVHTDVKI